MGKTRIGSLAVVLTAFILISSSCKEDEIDYTEAELSLIEDFMARYNYDIEPDPTGLYYQEVTPGTGDHPVALDTLEVYYTGYFLSGLKFDGNTGDEEPFRFTAQDIPPKVITGWDIGVTYMKAGGEAIFIIPSWLAYGTSGRGAIPGYSPLFFEVEVVNIIPGPNH